MFIQWVFPILAAALVLTVGCSNPEVPAAENSEATKAQPTAAATPASLPEVRYYMLSDG